MRSEITRMPSGRPEARVHSTCNGFSLSEDNRLPIAKKPPIFYFDPEASVSTQNITESNSAAGSRLHRRSDLQKTLEYWQTRKINGIVDFRTYNSETLCDYIPDDREANETVRRFRSILKYEADDIVSLILGDINTIKLKASFIYGRFAGTPPIRWFGHNLDENQKESWHRIRVCDGCKEDYSIDSYRRIVRKNGKQWCCPGCGSSEEPSGWVARRCTSNIYHVDFLDGSDGRPTVEIADMIGERSNQIEKRCGFFGRVLGYHCELASCVALEYLEVKSNGPQTHPVNVDQGNCYGGVRLLNDENKTLPSGRPKARTRSTTENFTPSRSE